MTEPTSIAEPLFLTGTTRSGTTLLSLMLGHHPRIAFAGELEWVWDFAPQVAAAELAQYRTWLATHRHFLHHRLRIDSSATFEDLARSFLDQMAADATAGRAGASVIGWQLHRHYARALAVWPRARFIHIVRDGRDVCASWIKFGWLGSAYEAGRRWSEALAEWQAVKPRIDPKRSTEIRFEDLIRAPERELERLCTFLGVPYSPAMLRYHEDTTYERPDPGQAGKWRRQLSRREVRLFEAVAAGGLAANGYAPSGEPSYRLQPWSGALLGIEDKLRHHRARARLYGTRLWFADIVARWLGTRAWQDRVRLALNDVENARIK